MLAYGRRYLLALPFVLLMVVSAPAGPDEKPTARQIAQWIEQLGDNKFSLREKASKKLWAAGPAAEAALEQATRNDDAEVARRARDILEKFKWGIYPDTPADIVALIKAYQSAESSTRPEILQKLLQAGPTGLQVVLKIARNEKDPNQRRAVGALVSSNLPASLPQVLEGNDYKKFEVLLEIGHESEFIPHHQYAAYWLLRGKLDERIAHFRALLSKDDEDRHSAETLVYLYRARGDLAEARKAAEKAKRDDLLDGLLYEAADWKALAARNDFSGTQSTLEKLAYRAAFARLAGKPKECEGALEEIRGMIAKPPERDSQQFAAAKALFLNDRLTEALDLLTKTPQRATMRFEILVAQLKYQEAMKILDEPRPADSKEQKHLEILKARTLYLLGEKDKAQELFGRLADQIKDGVDPFWVNSLVETEYRLGLKDQALDHAGRALGASPPGNVKLQPHTLYLSKLFPDHVDTAGVWWDLLRQRFKEETPAKTLKRLRDLMDGKIAAKEIKAWIEEAENTLSAPNPRAPLPQELVRQWQALAEAAVSARLEDLAMSLLEKADAPETLLRLGDLLAGKKEWAKAAERYRQSWRKATAANAPTAKGVDPLPLYLAGNALVKAGKETEGKKLIERSHRVSLADGATRFAFLRALAERGHADAAQREADLLLRVSEPNSYYSGVAARRVAIRAAAHKDYLKAADGFEQSMLRCLHPYTNFVQPGAYVAVPAQVHQMRAGGLLASGKIEEARKHIEIAKTLLPGNVDLPIKLVPELERRGHKKEATALFEKSYETYENVCRDYPRCAWAHNSAAWMSACCRRNLDKALAHAQKATELAPDNAGYLDTLAEVQFQRGDKEKAVALQKRVIELDPKKVYFRKQLKRLEAGDPSAERPPENEE